MKELSAVSCQPSALRFGWTRDFALIRAVLTHPSQARMSSDDGTHLPSWSPSEDERVWYVAAHAGDELLGIFTFVPQNAVCSEIHAALLPIAWGQGTRWALRGAIDFFWGNTYNLNMGAGIPRIVCSIPHYNKLAIGLAKDCGFRAYGRNPSSWLRHAKLHDQVLLGVSKL
jgi:RimJ/RimL family protein N-acetyltransferase